MAMRAYRFFRSSLRRKPEPDAMEVESENEPDEKFREKCNRFGKKLLMFMFSHVGLTGLVVGYAILGGVIFMQLEAPYEIREKTVVGNIRNLYVQKLWVSTKKLNILFRPNWTIIADEILKDFQMQVFLAVKEKGWDGSEGESTTSLQWTYAGALLYAVTIITTIGYGHIAPKTVWGRVATIIYALIGIPLTLLCLANIGGALGKCFRFIYGRIMCGLCRRYKRRKVMRNTTTLNAKEQNTSCCKIDRQSRKWCLCCRRNSTEDPNETAGDSQFVDNNGYNTHVQKNNASCCVKKKLSKRTCGCCGRNKSDDSDRHDTNPVGTIVYGLDFEGNGSSGLENNLTKKNKTGFSVEVSRIPEPVDTIVTYQADSLDYDDEIIRVPVIVTMGIMAAYIFGGAMLFTLWEKDWDYLIGSYFCFITLSTIGFGDFVPGTSLQSWASQEKRLLCSLYLLFGLALLAMCFDLMQEQVRYTCRRIGMWIGIIEQHQS